MTAPVPEPSDPIQWQDSFSVRPMTSDDIEAVHRLESCTNPSPWTAGIIRNCLSSGYRCWLLEHDSQLAGYVVTMVAVGEGHLLNIAVAPEFQRQGLGRRLLTFAATDARSQQAEVMFLEVRASNTPAIELYLHNEFTEVGVRKNYYPGKERREDALVMIKDLQLYST